MTSKWSVKYVIGCDDGDCCYDYDHARELFNTPFEAIAWVLDNMYTSTPTHNDDWDVDTDDAEEFGMYTIHFELSGGTWSGQITLQEEKQ